MVQDTLEKNYTLVQEGRGTNPYAFGNGLGHAQIVSSTSWDSSCTAMYISKSAYLRQSTKRSPLLSHPTVTVMSPEAFS
jgi:hypothetical protein